MVSCCLLVLSTKAYKKVKGVYFQWNNEPANPVVKDWNVAEMRVCSAEFPAVVGG
jgi:hypothetical protein